MFGPRAHVKITECGTHNTCQTPPLVTIDSVWTKLLDHWCVTKLGACWWAYEHVPSVEGPPSSFLDPNVEINYGKCLSRGQRYFFKAKAMSLMEQKFSYQSSRDISKALMELPLMLSNPVPKVKYKASRHSDMRH